MSRSDLKAQAGQPNEDPQSAGLPVQIPPPPRAPQLAAWLLGRSFNELQHRLQAGRLTSSQGDQSRNSELWENLAALMADLVEPARRHDVVTQLEQYRADWQDFEESEWWSEHVADANRQLVDLQDNGSELQAHRDEIDLLLDLAGSGNAELRELRALLVSACDVRGVVNHFETGALADQLVHRPINRETYRWLSPQVAPPSGMSWVVDARTHPGSSWRLPTALPPANPDWPDDAWYQRLLESVARVTQDAGAVQAFRAENHRPGVLEVEELVLGQIIDPAEGGDEDGVRLTAAGRSRATHLGLRIDVAQRRVQGSTAASDAELSRQLFNLLVHLLNQGSRPTSVDWFRANWSRFGRADGCTEQTVFAAIARLNDDLGGADVTAWVVGGGYVLESVRPRR